MLDASARPGILKPIRLVIVDRQPIVLQGLKSVLGTQQDFDVVAASSDGASCLEALRRLTPDIALIADTLPDLTAAEILAVAKAEKLSTRLIFFTEPEIAPDLTSAIAAGACSAISKYVPPADMLHALRLMSKSGVSLGLSDLSPKPDEADGGKIEKMLALLTDRERQVARLVSEGMSNKEIARKLNVSHGTVKVHLYNIFQKLEITNRTVLATIALLQRTSGFGALALAFLAFAVADELKASEANDISPNADDAGHAGEHSGYEVWKKAILQRLIVSDSGETPVVTERHVLARASEVTNPAAAMEALRAAEEFMGAKPWKHYDPVGSITPSSAALVSQRMSDLPIESGLLPEHRLASNPTLHGAYGTFAALAGALIYALSEAEAAAKPVDPAHASIDRVLASLGENAATTLAAVTHVGANQADKSAADLLSHDVGLHSVSAITANHLVQDGVQSHAGPDTADHNLQKAVGLLETGRDGSAGLSRDQLIGADVASGPGRLNLAAFGALAWLHLTAAAKSIPPHTLAWVYDPSTNETIVYVNTTDRVLEVGDRALMEVHLQGIVSIAEADVVQPDGGAVAATLEQLEQALMPAVLTDETGLGTGSIHAGEGSNGEAAIWSASAEDGLSFHFAEDRTGFRPPTKFKTSTSDSTETTEQSAVVSAYGSSSALGQSAAVPPHEKLASKGEPVKADTGAPPAQQSEVVPPGLATADGTGHGNAEHAPAAEPQSTEPGKAVGKDAEHQAPPSKAAKGAAAEKTSEPVEHGKSGHDEDLGDAKASAQATKPGKSVSKGAEHQAQASKEAKGAAAETTSEPVEHGNSGHVQHPGPANASAASATGSAGAKQPHHASEPGNAKASAESAKPGKSVGKGAEHQAPASQETADTAAEKASTPVKHVNSGHGSEPGDAQAADVVAVAGGSHAHHASDQRTAKGAAESGKGTKDQGPAAKDGWVPSAEKTSEAAEHGHGHDRDLDSANAPAADVTDSSAGGSHAQYAYEPKEAKTAAGDMAEAKPTSHKGVVDDNGPESPGSEDSAGAKADANIGGDHGNSAHASSANAQDADPNVVTADGGGRAHAPHDPHPDHGGGNDKGQHSPASDDPAGAQAAEQADGENGHAGRPADGNVQQAAHSGADGSQPAKPSDVASESGADHEAVFRFAAEVSPSSPAAAIEPKGLNETHAPPGQNKVVQMIADIAFVAPDEPTAQHGDHGSHHGPAPHDWLI